MMEMVKQAHWIVRGELQIGQRVTVEGRDYFLRDLRRAKDELGHLSLLLTWGGCCDVCGCRFNFKAPLGKFVPTATCKRHWSKA